MVSSCNGIDSSVSIAELIPHGAGMRLIEQVVTADADHAITRSTVRRHWPMITGDGCSPIVLIEVAAQTAGVCIGLSAHAFSGTDDTVANGWLVGIKQARFFADMLPMAACITTCAEICLTAGAYREVAARAELSGALVGEIRFQVLRGEPTGEPLF